MASDLLQSATPTSEAANEPPKELLAKFKAQRDVENRAQNGDTWPVNPMIRSGRAETAAAPSFEALVTTKEDKPIRKARVENMYDKSDEYIEAQHLGKGRHQLVLTVIWKRNKEKLRIISTQGLSRVVLAYHIHMAWRFGEATVDLSFSRAC